MTAGPEISIVVPLADDVHKARKCLEGIAQQPETPTYEVIVVDNASHELGPLLHSLGGDVKIIRSERHLGLWDALRASLEHVSSRLVAVLRDAAVPDANWLAPLVEALEDQSVGLTASATRTGSGREEGLLTTLCVASHTVDLHALGRPNAPDQLFFAAIALELAEGGMRTTCVPESLVSAARDDRPAARRTPTEAPELTIVIPTLNAASECLRSCVESIHRQTVAAHELVIVDNGSPPQGFTAPVNAGVRAADSPYVVIMNDDVEVLPGWWEPLRAALEQGGLVACPHTIEGGMRFDFPAWCFALDRRRIGMIEHAPGQFYDPELKIWYQDTDLLHRLNSVGAPPVLVADSRIRHRLSQTLSSPDPVLRAWIDGQIEVDRERYMQKHPDADPGCLHEYQAVSPAADGDRHAVSSVDLRGTADPVSVK